MTQGIGPVTCLSGRSPDSLGLNLPHPGKPRYSLSGSAANFGCAFILATTILGCDSNPQHVDSGGPQGSVLALNVSRIVWRPQTLIDFLQRGLDAPQRLAEWNSAEGPARCSPIRVSFVVQKQISAADAVLVLIDSVRPSHEHEADAALGSEPCLKRCPVRCHGYSLLGNRRLRRLRCRHLLVHPVELLLQGDEFAEFGGGRYCLAIGTSAVCSRGGCRGDAGFRRR